MKVREFDDEDSESIGHLSEKQDEQVKEVMTGFTPRRNVGRTLTLPMILA
jgi:hypothetical protein